MDRTRLSIIDEYNGEVKLEMLEQNTVFLTTSEMERIRWEDVKCLHIYGKLDQYDTGDHKAKKGYYVARDGSWVLAYLHSAELVQQIISLYGRYLEELFIVDLQMTTLDVSGIKVLKKLDYVFYDRIGPCLVEGIEDRSDLEILRLVDAVPKTMLDVSGMTHLNELMVVSSSRNSEQYHTITGFQQLKNLECLCLAGVWGEPSLDVSGMPALELLYLPENKALCHLEGLARLQHLEDLHISETGIRRLPEDIRKLRRLQYLDLSGLALDELPDWLPELGLEFHLKKSGSGICLENTTVEGVDMSIFSQPREMIEAWFTSRKQDNEVPLNEIKVVFLGDGEAGKSHTIARLLGDGGAPLDYTDKATPGIVIKNKEYDLDGQKIQVHFWDFGGQEIMHSMHRIFLTERTLYVVLVNARDETQDARARYWLHNITSYARNAPVLLVINKMDQNPNASVNERDLRYKYSCLKQVVKMSALCDPRERFNSNFTDVMLDLIRQMGVLDIRWPASWSRVKAQLEQMKTNYIEGEEYKQICRASQVDTSQKDLLHWFHDLGVTFCCCEDRKLEDYVILRPEWITNAIYIILFNRCEGTRNGLIPHDSIRKLLDPPAQERDRISRVLPDVVYSPDEIQYVINIIRKFQLSFDVENGCEFIPMLCQRDSMPVAEMYERDPATLEFQMEFDYLPNNVLHRLMVERREELDLEHVWLTGALFRQKDTRLSAVVTIDGNLLRIFVRGGDLMDRPNTYLSILKANADRIWKRMDLQEPRYRMVYKRDGKQELFDQAVMTAMLDAGQTHTFSMTWRQMLPIWDIMNQSAPAVEEDERKLLGDIAAACGMLQVRMSDRSSDEHGRNAALRDMLQSIGYVVLDQSLRGISFGRTSGEPDLDIRRYAHIPWTICEALRVSDGSKSAWNSHLRKVLDSYNLHGMPFLFLLTYVDCEKYKFGRIWESFQRHIHVYSTEGFECVPRSCEYVRDTRWDDTFLKVAKCQYTRDGYSPVVYHIFVRMGK